MVYRSRKHRKHGRKAHRGTRRIRGAGQFSGGSRRRHHRMKGGIEAVIMAV